MADHSGENDPQPDPQAEARRREAALRALAAESAKDASGAASTPAADAATPPGGAGPNRIGLYVGLGVLALLVVVVLVVLVSGGSDDGDEAGSPAGSGDTPAATSSDTSSDTSEGDTSEESTATSAGDDGGLPAPAGDPPPDLELTGEPEAAAESILAYRQWALANPGEVEPTAVAQPGSTAFDRLTNETALLVGGERIVVLNDPTFDVASVQVTGDTATFSGSIRWLRYSGFDVATGQVVEERGAGSQNVTGQLVRTADGWKLTELTVT